MIRCVLMCRKTNDRTYLVNRWYQQTLWVEVECRRLQIVDIVNDIL